MLKKYKVIGILISAPFMLIGCNSDKKPEFDNSFIGVWQKTAYGEILDISKETILRYEYNQHSCIKTHTLQRNNGLPPEISALSRTSNNMLNVTYQGELSSNPFTKTSTLPTSCKSPINTTGQVSATQTFDHFWHTFNDYYAFFELREVDWQAQYDQFKPLITDAMDDEALFTIMSTMVEPLQDGHVFLSAEQYEFSGAKPSPLLDAIQGLARASLRTGQELDESDVISSLIASHQSITSTYITPASLRALPETKDTKTFIWGKTTDNIGILTINNMADFDALEDASNADQLQALQSQLDMIIQDLAETDALIVDIRINTGGSDNLALAIAGRFATQDILAFNKQAINESGLGTPVRALIKQHSAPYNKPVYLLTSQITTSAAEIFTMAMRQFSHVTQVGEETSGEFSDVLSFTLPNGWEMGLSNEVYRNAQGENFERVGISPHINVSAFNTYEMDSHRFASYDYVLNHLGKQSYLPLKPHEFTAQVNEIMAKYHLPGLSAAIIHEGATVFSAGFGVQDLNNTAVSADTPFFLASVSKVLVGATLAQAVDKKHISLDEKITPLLPFPLYVPNNQANEISFRHLITHTSSIIDNPSIFNCTYYVLDSQVSLYNLMTEEDLCPSQVDADLPEFFRQYLSDKGTFNTPQNYSQQYDYSVGEVHIYSNIATDLAAYALAKKLDTPFTELSQRYVFTPLNMHNTYWGLDTPSSDVAKRLYLDPITMQPAVYPNYRSITYADGSVISTANDLTYFLKAAMNKGKVDGKQVFSRNMVNQMLSSQTETPTRSRDIGYFWQLDGDIIHHNGADPGVLTYLIGDTRTQNGIILLSNGDINVDMHGEALDEIKTLALRLAYTYQP
ncbi:hypothetical protein BGP78_14105 [Pseudoalteromonas sp. MSK9-3]|uniref:serine hydrolase n=1 Tax=Pseudoalteromonas sp. MSK9-3 TaxID=1897633 RepID=UPI000E6B722F|nr:serine hydrolase [Pseudoalteromonas sp. MSK9-3]RJE76139.1 hypothetical protein BGP78_14105 [Pseudoalteromonas sp. MSK9-3]